jgi:hypothetical protein
MTEDEARTRWCPFARAADGDFRFARNRITDKSGRFDGAMPADCLCLASDCMAWPG